MKTTLLLDDEVHRQAKQASARLGIPLTRFIVAWDIEARFKLSSWDSMIVAAAHLSECRFLLSEDLQESIELNNVSVINPFSTSAETFSRELL